MGSSSASYVIQQLLSQSPILLAGLLGLILPPIFWKRCPAASLLTLIATLILLFATVAVVGLQTYMASARMEQGWTMTQYSEMTGAVGLLGGLARALAIGLLVIAVFTGRKRVS